MEPVESKSKKHFVLSIIKSLFRLGACYGIWMWGAPKKSKLPSGEECYVIVLDTEGIGGVESNAQYDARIFSLALLLCSSLIYNSMGSIDEAAISNLSFVAQLSQHIHLTQPTQPSDETGTANNDHDESSGFDKIFPSKNLLIVLTFW